MAAAASHGDYDAIERLIARGASASSTDASGRTALHLLASGEGGDSAASCVRVLVKHGCPVRARTPSGVAALEMAVVSPTAAAPEVCKALIDAGADLAGRPPPGATSGRGGARAGSWSPLHLAARAADVPGRTAVISLLIDAGAGPDEQGFWRRTPLMCATQAGALEAVAVLLHAGASASAADARGWTALHIAAAHPTPTSPTIIAALATAGANLNARTARGETPLSILVRTAGPGAAAAETGRALVAAGASLDNVNAAGRSAFEVARSKRRGWLIPCLTDAPPPPPSEQPEPTPSAGAARAAVSIPRPVWARITPLAPQIITDHHSVAPKGPISSPHNFE